MKRTLIAIARPICRLIASALWQLVWLLPLWGVCWYGKSALPRMIRGHFGIDQAESKLASLTQFSDLMKANSSLTNPTAIVHYLSAQLAKFTATAKLNTLEITSNVLQTVCIWGLNLLWICALIYAVIRTIRLYRSKSETFDTAQAVTHQIQPQLILIQQQIMDLHNEIQELKLQQLQKPEQSEQTLLTHE